MPWVSRVRTAIAILLVFGALLGCSRPPTPRAPLRLRVMVAPSTAPLVEQLVDECRSRIGPVEIQTSEGSADAALRALQAGQVDLALVERDLSEGEIISPETLHPALRVWPIGLDGIAVVVHPDNPAQTLSREQLRQVFTGQERRWSKLGGADATIQVLSRDAGSPTRNAFEASILPGQHVVGAAIVLPTDRAVADYVAKHPEAIGYLSSAWAAGDVKVLAVDNVFPQSGMVTQGEYPLRHPLVFVSRHGTPGDTLAFIRFVLSPEGQEVVARTHAAVSGS